MDNYTRYDRSVLDRAFDFSPLSNREPMRMPERDLSNPYDDYREQEEEFEVAWRRAQGNVLYLRYARKDGAK